VISPVQPAICWKLRASRATHRVVRPGVYDSDNVTGDADNQQERLIRTGWVVGFVDGEGCFSVGFVRQPNRVNRKGYKTGYQVSHRFVVTQGAKSLPCLEELQSFFGVGRLFENRRHDNHREHLWQYIVDRRADLLDTIIPFFVDHPLHSAKRLDFEKFALCLKMVERGRHLESEGLLQIALITETMNREKPRRDLIRILRGHTPATS
jgi:LAGLIDADG endonuclease